MSRDDNKLILPVKSKTAAAKKKQNEELSDMGKYIYMLTGKGLTVKYRSYSIAKKKYFGD